MSRRPQTTNPCTICTAMVPRSTPGLAICAECRELVWLDFKREQSGAHPNERQRAWNRLMGDRDALVARARALRAQVAA